MGKLSWRILTTATNSARITETMIEMRTTVYVSEPLLLNARVVVVEETVKVTFSVVYKSESSVVTNVSSVGMLLRIDVWMVI